MASTSLPLAGTLANDTSSIEDAVNVYPALHGTATANGKELYINGAFTEPSFFSIFGFTLLEGNPAALSEPNSIILKKETAERFFGSVNVIGKSIKLDNGTVFLIKGVLNTPPGNTHLNYDAYASYTSVAAMEEDRILGDKSDDWFAFNAGYTYILLRKNTQQAAVKASLHSIASRLNSVNKEGSTSFHLQPLDEISPGTEYLNNDNAAGTSWSKIYIETTIALLILLAACFNYTNLTIARSLTRAKEVGIRKIAGAKRSQVFAQYIFESVLLSLLALAFAWLILSFIVRYAPFNDGYEFIPSSFQYNGEFIVWTIGYALFAGLLAGSAPAWILSAFTPLRVLKNLTTAKIFGKVGIQKVLIVFQYSLSLVFIIFLLVFYKQFSYMGKLDPGYKRDNVIVLPLNGVSPQVVSQELHNVSGIQSVAASTANFAKRFNGLNTTAWLSNKNEAFNLPYYYANPGFIHDMHFSLIAGQNFPESTSGKEQYLVINEAAAHALGFTDVKKAEGEKIWINDSTQLQVRGILKNFNFENAGKPIGPLAFRTKDSSYTYLYVTTLAGTDKANMLKKVNDAVGIKSATVPAQASWLSDDLAKSNSQVATISLLGFLGFIALAVASLGLLGLVVYTVEVKGKEISIRKVVGASSVQLVNILSKEFIKLLFIAGLIAMPIGWFLSVMFLENFSKRIDFGFGSVIMCFLFLLGIGLLTIISQTYKAATDNPAIHLRTE